MMNCCFIFSGGALNDTSFIDKEYIVRSGSLVICADKGYKYAKALGIKPDILIGDFDSYTDELPADAEIIRTPAEKDDTDTMLAVKLAIERGCEFITLYGALGARFDHTFANIQTLIYAHEHGCDLMIDDGDNIVSVQGICIRSYGFMDGWYLSLFSLSEQSEITRLTGVKYPINNLILKDSYPLGVSNEIIAREAVLSVASGLVLVVQSKDTN
ncbi:MAG: thiamine diphosphokinase [Ruminococcus sp.]|jgi:thiamine pyrophosphokinase|nr:thiamine diphosphokinase [Ruminococcus sp.]